MYSFKFNNLLRRNNFHFQKNINGEKSLHIFANFGQLTTFPLTIKGITEKRISKRNNFEDVAKSYKKTFTYFL